MREHPPKKADDRGKVAPVRYIREKELKKLVPVDRATIRRWEHDNLFPRRHKIGPNAVGWLESGVLAWQDKNAAGP